MKAPGGSQGAVILLVVVSLAGCSEAVVFPADDSGAAGAAGAGGAALDGSIDVRVDAGRQDGVLDISADPDVMIRVEGGDGAGTCESRCASGVCDMKGDCKPCVKDEECTSGRVCGSGVCALRCGDGGVACQGSFVCCNEQCVDTTLDRKHCGACGTTCPATQFCANASVPPLCKDNILVNVCNSKKATFLLDGLQADQEANAVVQAAIAARCTPSPMATAVSQSVSTAINTTTGQPVAGGGELLVAVGGDSAQRLVKYLEASGTSHVYNEYDGLNTLWFKRRDAAHTIVATVTKSTLTSTHDYFLIEVVSDSISGTLSLVIYGVDSPGTKAGAYYFANTILTSIATYTSTWYLYEWAGTSADGGTGPGDTFTPLASGM
ncbi:MAG TPA: hypothetical protein VK540_01830 [Polyangiaceae bacterium]|nr:hypothetical protein [Polyangiaceae bacterium]